MMNDRKTLREAKKDRRIKKEKIVEKTNKLNRKQQLLKKTAEQRMIFKNLTIEWQEKLYDPVDSTILQESAKYLLPHQYQEVIEERNAYNLCGYPLCSNNKQVINGQFRILNQERKIYDLTELKCYCSTTCFTSSRFFYTQLSDEPVYIRNFQSWKAIQVIPLGADVREIVKQELERKRLDHETNLRYNYVKNLMADLPPAPPGINIKEKENLEIQTLAGINSDQKYAHDAIEGYCIDFQKSNSKKINPTTFILPKEKTFDTKDKLQTTKSTEGNINSKSRNTDSQNKIVNYENTISEFAKKVIRDEDKILSSPSQQRPSIKLNNTKKKKVILQMSLFGRIWTALDRMTTSNTRIYFKKLNSYNSEMNKKVELENSYNNFENNEIMTTRIQIFTEKVMECFYLLKPQLSITINIESELIELMSTFRFDNLLVMLKNLENNILCMVFIYALSIDIPQLHENIFSSDSRSLTNIKSVTFNVLLKSMNITTEELDAFVRVLRVGST